MMDLSGRPQFDAFLISAVVLSIMLVPAAIFLSRRASEEHNIGASRELGWFLRTSIGYMAIGSVEMLIPGEFPTFGVSAVGYLFVAAAPTWWFLFALEYGGYDRFAERVRRYLWIVPPLAFLIFATNPLHHSYWTDWYHYVVGPYSINRSVRYGPSFWVLWGYLLALVVSGTAVILRANFRNVRTISAQSLIVSLGALIPIAVNGVFVLRLVPGFHKDFTPISFGLAGLVCAIGVFSHRLFELEPIARWVLVEALSDGLLALDEKGRVVDANPSARRICGLGDAPRDWPEGGGSFLAGLLSMIDKSGGQPVEVSPDGKRWFEVRYESVRAGARTLRLLAMRDVTERRLLIDRLVAAQAEIESLEEIIPICACCKKIRDDTGYWQQVERYFGEHTGIRFSHGICPDCKNIYYPEVPDGPA